MVKIVVVIAIVVVIGPVIVITMTMDVRAGATNRAASARLPKVL